MNLTIVIPTFDRPQEVNQRLIEIEKEFGCDIPVIVQVNPGLYDANDIIRRPRLNSLVINQNFSNIGFVANIVSGLSLVRSEWVWILGDDDPLRTGLEKLLASTFDTCDSESADIALFNQWHQPQDSDAKICSTLDEFTRATGFSDCLFISAIAWRTSFLLESLGLLIDYSFTRASQAVIQLAALTDGVAKICVINRALINYRGVHRWSRLDYLQRVDKILYHSSLSCHRRSIIEFIRPQVLWAFNSSLTELSAHESRLTWINLAFRYSINEFRGAGLHKSVVFFGKLAAPLIRLVLSKVKSTVLHHRTMQLYVKLSKSLGRVYCKIYKSLIH